MIGVQAPVHFELSQPTGRPGYKVTVRNKHWFTTTAGLVFVYRLMLDGLPVQQGEQEGWTEFDLAQILPQVRVLATLSTSNLVLTLLLRCWLSPAEALADGCYCLLGMKSLILAQAVNMR